MFTLPVYYCTTLLHTSCLPPPYDHLSSFTVITWFLCLFLVYMDSSSVTLCLITAVAVAVASKSRCRKPWQKTLALLSLNTKHHIHTSYELSWLIFQEQSQIETAHGKNSLPVLILMSTHGFGGKSPKVVQSDSLTLPLCANEGDKDMACCACIDHGSCGHFRMVGCHCQPVKWHNWWIVYGLPSLKYKTHWDRWCKNKPSLLFK